MKASIRHTSEYSALFIDELAASVLRRALSWIGMQINAQLHLVCKTKRLESDVREHEAALALIAKLRVHRSAALTGTELAQQHAQADVDGEGG